VEPHFQPIVDLKTRKVIGFEALARWTDRDLGSVSPATFIPIAEERGIIGPLSQLVLRKATEAARDWPSDLFLSFNLSPSQLVDQNTGLQILSILNRTGFDPRRLEIEITETGLMTDPASAEKIVDDLKRVGIRVSLDDFGTGQSSLGRLREFHFDKLKIDRAFVSSMVEDKPSEHIIRAILAMCEGLGMDVVAEGIEDEQQADRLDEFGCAGGQGYLFGKPANAETTLGYLRRNMRSPAHIRSA
jgi:EAL domain-containing protein (putative c-di-GMP-specific phosphodiesterase class I)